MATIGSMSSGKQPPPGPFARAISSEVRSLMGRHRLTVTRLASLTNLSRGYLTKRLHDEVPFTVNDVEVICASTDEDLRIFMGSAFRSLGSDR